MGEASAHNLLSPSGAHRWLKCPPSAILCSKFPSKGSKYTEEGTIAHLLAEGELNKNAVIIEEAKSSKYYSNEMQLHVNGYVSYVKSLLEPLDIHYTELPVSLDWYSPGKPGTIDKFIFNFNKRTIRVIDLKYGAGERVSAYQNDQARIYAASAIRWYINEYDKQGTATSRSEYASKIETIEYHIYQPRVENGISTWSESRESLEEYSRTVIQTAKLALKGEGLFAPGEKQCRFCSVRAKCKARTKAIMEPARKHDYSNPALLTDDELASLLPVAKMAEKFLKDVESECYARATSGKKIEGYKLVKGTTRRKFADPEAMVKFFKKFYAGMGLTSETVVGIGEVTKIIGKEAVASLEDAGLIIKPEGAPRLVPETDKGEAINDPFNQFKELINTSK